MREIVFFRPDDDDDVDQGWAILAVCWLFIALALISTLLRVWVRWRITRNLGSDDWVMVVAMVGIGCYAAYYPPTVAETLRQPPSWVLV